MRRNMLSIICIFTIDTFLKNKETNLGTLSHLKQSSLCFVT